MHAYSTYLINKNLPPYQLYITLHYINISTKKKRHTHVDQILRASPSPQYSCNEKTLALREPLDRFGLALRFFCTAQPSTLSYEQAKPFWGCSSRRKKKEKKKVYVGLVVRDGMMKIALLITI